MAMASIPAAICYPPLPLGGFNKLAYVYRCRSSCRRNAKPICNGHGVAIQPEKENFYC
eukprot:COSAG01_NODE_6063_length_3874_cov_5.778278_3_plen_58_part_00